MAQPTTAAGLLDLPLEVLADVCQRLDFCDLVRVAGTYTRFRHGDGGLETAELPSKSPVVTALLEHAFPGGEQTPSTRPSGCSESWVAYLARCARQRRCREAPTISAGSQLILFLDAAGSVLACGQGAAVGHGDESAVFSVSTPSAGLIGVRVRSVAASARFSLALGWDGRVYSWGKNEGGLLGLGDPIDRTRLSLTLVKGLADVCSISAGGLHSLALTQLGDVYIWGNAIQPGAQCVLSPIIVEGFGEGVRMRRVCAGRFTAFAIGENGEVFSWGYGDDGILGHGDTQHQPAPKRVEALRGVPVIMASDGRHHAIALTEDGLVYTWGGQQGYKLLGDPHVERELLPRRIEALRSVRVSSVAADGFHSYAVAGTGEV
jgi:alpha-tubulin suppressor-like RCC1 family protein